MFKLISCFVQYSFIRLFVLFSVRDTTHEVNCPVLASCENVYSKRAINKC